MSQYPVPVRKMGNSWHSDNPFVICPYYTGRDKGALRGTTKDGVTTHILAFFNEGRAWKYIFDVVQPNDSRACDNYRVVRLSEYLED